MHNTPILKKIAYVLVLVGALNWGLIGAFDFNLVAAIFGASVITKIIYILIGLAAIYKIAMMGKCKGGSCCDHEHKAPSTPSAPHGM